jgi:hypothetical protein
MMVCPEGKFTFPDAGGYVCYKPSAIEPILNSCTK